LNSSSINPSKLKCYNKRQSFKLLKANLIVQLLLLSSLLCAQNKSIDFYHLDISDGLSNNGVKAIYKDSKGLIWIGTENGLNKFDGYSFTVYKNSLSNYKSISGNRITSIVEGKDGELWIGTDVGLNIFERESETFTRCIYQPDLKNTKQNPKVQFLYKDHMGYIWVIYENSFEILDVKNKKTVKLLSQSVLNVLKNKLIRVMYEDRMNQLWIGTWNGGLIKIDSDRKNAIIYQNNPADPQSLPDNTVKAMYEDNQGILWLGTYSSGLCSFNLSTGRFKKTNILPFSNYEISAIVPVGNNDLWISHGHSVSVINVLSGKEIDRFTNQPNNPHSFIAGIATSIYKDNTNILWISSDVEGAVFYDPNRDKFSKFYNKISKENTDEQYYITSYLFDKEHNNWLGTFGKGLLFYDKKQNNYIQFSTKQGLLSNYIKDICQLKSGVFWVGTSAGITIFDPKSKKVVGKLIHSELNPNSLYHNSIYRIFSDTRNNIWVATQESLDWIQGSKFTHFTKNNLNGLSHYKITNIFEDKEGNIWIATSYGLNKYDYKTNKITQYFADAQRRNSLSSSDIFFISQDSHEMLFVGTRNGLNSYDKKTDTFSPFPLTTELESEIVYGIMEDENKNFWITTASGLQKINMKSKVVKRYDDSEGLKIGYQPIAKDHEGRFYIGGQHTGFYCFSPSQIIDNRIVPPIYISSFLLFNKPVPIEPGNKNAILQKHISATKQLNLNYNQTVISFEGAALNYTLPAKNQYAYKLEGFDGDWVYMKANRRFISYSNLYPGTYTLKIKACNNDGEWNENPVTLSIVISPPFWRTTFAYFIYFFLIIALLFIFRYYSLLRYKEKAEIEIDRLKIHFFTNISHEFRTPLTLIMGPLGKLLNEAKTGTIASERLLQQFSLMQRNAQRLMLLINQLLDLQKSETGTLKLELSHGDLPPFLKSIFNAFIPLSEQNGIQYNFYTSVEKFEMSFDTDKLEKIVVNLLSNAFNFTKKSVELKLSVVNEQIIIEVKDDGVGIAKENLTNIFRHFYQVDNTLTRKNKGSGIGLALTRELVILHKGTIKAESELGLGTTMTVTLPVCHQTTKSEEFHTTEKLPEISMYQQEITILKDELPIDRNKPVVLIVEDNADLRLYISDVLSANYTIAEAENGRIGVEIAMKILPELIVSDVMMPEMDGMQFTRTLKSNGETCHIPIILLTSLDSGNSKLTGCETGADDYVTKPFNAELLLARIKNLIDLRHRLRLKFQQSLDINPNDFTSNVSDEKLLKKAIELVENNIENTNFDIQQFIDGMNMSRAGLYAKIKALTGLTVSDFIKSIRLRRAAKILLSKEYTVTEVCYLVGFNSPSYFYKTFKEQFLMSPTEFIHTHSNS